MGAGAGTNTQGNGLTQMQMAEMSYFNNQVQKMKFAKLKGGFKHKSDETKQAITQTLIKLKRDKLLDTADIRKWGKTPSLAKKQEIKPTKTHERNRSITEQRPKIERKSTKPNQIERALHMGELSSKLILNRPKNKSEMNLIKYDTYNLQSGARLNISQVRNSKPDVMSRQY